jgi:hypothetical protein
VKKKVVRTLKPRQLKAVAGGHGDGGGTYTQNSYGAETRHCHGW